jgi:hypothetical protein
MNGAELHVSESQWFALMLLLDEQENSNFGETDPLLPLRLCPGVWGQRPQDERPMMKLGELIR